MEGDGEPADEGDWPLERVADNGGTGRRWLLDGFWR